MPLIVRQDLPLTADLSLTDISQVGTTLLPLPYLRTLRLGWPMMAAAVNICVQSLSGHPAHKVQIQALMVATSVEASIAAQVTAVLVGVTARAASESFQQASETTTT